MRGPTCIFWANLTPFSLQGAQDALAADIDDAAVAARRQMVKDAVKLGFAVGLAAIAAPFTGGASLLVAGAYIAMNPGVRDAALALGADVFDAFKCSKQAMHAYDRISQGATDKGFRGLT